MILIDKLAYVSQLKERNPTLKLNFALATLFVCLWADSAAISGLVILIMGGLTVGKGGTAFPLYVRLLFVPAVFLLLSVLTIMVSISPEPAGIVSVPVGESFIIVTSAGFHLGISLAFKALGAVSCIYFLVLSTPMLDILYVLQRWKTPQILLEMMLLIYRYIFVLLEVLDKMLISQKARLGNGGLKARGRAFAGIASSLFISAMKKSEDLMNSMEARGYDGTIAVLAEEHPFSRKELVWIIIFEVILIGVTLWIKARGAV